MFEELKDYIASHTKEEIQEDWKETPEFESGMTVEEFLQYLLLSSKTKRIMKLFIICFIILFSSCGVYIPHKRVNELYNMIPGKAFYEITDSIPTKSERKVVKEYLNHYRYYQY